MGSPSNKKLKRHLIAWTLVVFALAVSVFGTLRLGVYYSSDILYELVKRETNGHYLISFEEININLWQRAIKLKQVRLRPDPEKRPDEEGLNNLYDLDLAGLNIDLKSILSIYTDRQLLMENVRIIDPKIHVTKKRNTPDESFSLQTGNLYKEISDYLRVLQIDFFAVEDALIKHSPSQFSLGNMNFLMKNLLIDSASRPDRQFYSESIELEINNQGFLLGDSIHHVSFDRFLLSTADSVLTFDNLVLKPVDEYVASAENTKNRIIYDISIPKLNLIGIDYFTAYRFNHLEMKELAITDSQISLEEQQDGEKEQTSKKENSLFNQLISVFDEVKIGKMRFINTNLNLKTNQDYNSNYQHVQSERADIVLYNFNLDSSNYQFDYGNKYFDDVDIIIHNYSSFLPDSVHAIDFELLRLSSFDSSLVFENFNISNHGSGSTSQMFLTIDLPQIRLEGLNYPDILTRKQLVLREMKLQNPNVIFKHPPEKSSQFNLTPDSLFALISDHFQQVSIGKLQVNKGAFSINDQFRSGQADLEVSNFRVPADTNSWYRALEDIRLEVYDLDLDNQTVILNAGHVGWDSLNSRFLINELEFDYQDKRSKTFGVIKNISLSGLNLDSLASGKFLAFDSINLIDPQVKLDILSPGEDQNEKKLIGNRFVEIVNGQFTSKRYDSTAVSIDRINTRFTVGSENYIQFGELENLKFTLPKYSKKLEINKLSLSKTQDLLLVNIGLQRIRDDLQHEVEFSGSIPTLTLYGFDQEAFWSDQKVNGDSLWLINPDLLISLHQNEIQTENKDSLKFELGKLIVDDMKLGFSDERQSNPFRIKTPNLSMTLERFSYPDKLFVGAEHLLYSDNVMLSVKELQALFQNGDSIALRQSSFDHDKGLILADAFRYRSHLGTSTVDIPRTKIVGTDINALVNGQQLKLDSVLLIAPIISHDQSTASINQSNHKTSTPENVNINWFSSIDTEIEVRDKSSRSYAMHRGEIEIHNYNAFEILHWEHLFNDAQYAKISGEEFIVELGDGYQLGIDKYAFNHPGNSVKLSNISLTSDYSPLEYSEQLSTQKDWFNVNASDITFSELDLDRLLSQKEFNTEKVSVDGLKALIYRDKNVPFDSTRVKSLPQSMLLDIDHWIYIDTLHVKGDITHRIRPENIKEVAEISFNEIDASLLKITTSEDMVEAPMRLIATGLLMDEAPFEISVMFDMEHIKDRFSFTGQIDQMPLESLNKLLRPLANINIRDGYGERINFNIKADNEVATGEMRFRYDDLKIQILNPDPEDSKNVNQGLKSFFANTFVINAKNPGFLVLKPGTIFRERDPSRVIFHYWGESLLSGAVSSIGINKSKKEEKRYEKSKEK